MPRLSSKAFDRAVREAMGRIPEEFLGHIEDVAILVEEEPSPEVLADLEVPDGETLFGVYFGIPHGERSVFDTQKPVPPTMYAGLYRTGVMAGRKMSHEII